MRSEVRLGVSPRLISIDRKLSVIAASATSLTVTPKRAHTLSTSAIDTSASANRRMSLTGPLRVDAAGRMSPPAISAAPCTACTATLATSVEVRHAELIHRSGFSDSEGADAGLGVSGLTTRSPPVSSNSRPSIRAADTPSAMQ